MTVILAAGVLSGQFEAAVAATTGALNIALLDAAVSRTVWSRALWLCLFSTTVIAFLAVLIGDDPWWLVPFLALLAFLQGSLSGAGVAVANATIAAMITAILFSVIPGSLGEAAVAAAWLFLGALIEVVVALFAWRWERQALLRRQVRRILGIAAADRTDRSVDRWIEAAGRTLATTELTVVERRGYDELLEVARAGNDSADLALAARIMGREATASGGGPAAAAARSIRFAADDPVPPAAESAGSQWRALTELVRPGSTSFTAGLRLALLMAIGAVLVQAVHLPQGHWALLVFALAIRPSYTDTVIGLIARVIGVLAGVVVTSAVAVTSDGSLIALLALAALSGILACRWLMGNDIVFFTFLTIFVCVLVDAGDPLSGFGAQRITATVVGAVIGLVGALLWPSWRRTANTG